VPSHIIIPCIHTSINCTSGCMQLMQTRHMHAFCCHLCCLILRCSIHTVFLHHALFAPASDICVWPVLIFLLIMTGIASSWRDLHCRCTDSCCKCTCIDALSWHTCTILVLNCLAQHTAMPFTYVCCPPGVYIPTRATLQRQSR